MADNQRRSGRRSREPQQQISRHPRNPSIDATSMDSRTLAEVVRDSKKHSTLLAHIDFANVSEAKLHTLFLSGNERLLQRSTSNGAIIHPPIALRRTAKQIRNFYEAGLTQKTQLIDQYKNVLLCTSGMITYLESEFAPQAATSFISGGDSVAAGSIKSVSFAEDSSYKSLIAQESCGGISIEYISNMKYDAATREQRILGFKHTVREGWNTRERLEHPTNNVGFSWPFCLPVVSALTSGNDNNNIIWKIEQIDNRANYEEIGPDFCRFVIRHRNCDGTAGGTLRQGLCDWCFSKKKLLIDRFDSQITKRSNTIHAQTRTDQLRSSSLQQEKANYWMRKAINYRRRLTYKQRAMDKLLEETGVHVEINDASNQIFSSTNAERVKQFLESNPDDRGNAIAEYVFLENCEKFQQAKKFGRTSIRHSPLVIRLGALVLSKMGNGGDVYDLVAKACGLPSARSLRNYTTHSVNEPDGILYSQLETAQEVFNNKYDDLSPTSWQRSVRLAWDEMTVKGRFSVNHQTGKLIGVANDAFESSIIAREWAALAGTIENDEEEGEDREVTVPETTKHFLAVIATTITAGYKQHIYVARYGVKKTNYEFLAHRLNEISCALFDYGFVVRLMGNDGATENRTVTKLLANISAYDVLSTKFSVEELSGLNLQFNIAFHHPSPACRDVKIFFGSDMPHLVKKIRNAMDNKSRELVFRGNEISLKRVEEIWKYVESPGANLRKTHLGVDHFQLDSYKKMRVFLAVRVMSQSTRRMITEYCEDTGADIGDYRGMLEIFDKIDRLVDICNARHADQDTKNGTKRNTYKIDHPKHPHLKELFDVLKLFEEWKNEVGGFTKHFITKQTYEDLQWTVYGIAGVAVDNLEENCSKQFDQGISGSDCCEHFFTGIKQDCSNPTLGQANQAADKRTALNAITGGNQFKSKRAGSNTIGAGVDPNDYIAPIIKASKKRRGHK